MGLDTVEIVMSWEASFGIRISNAEAEKLVTVENAIDHIADQLEAHAEIGFCPPRRAFSRIRSALYQSGVARSIPIRLADQLSIFRQEGESRKAFANRFCLILGINGFKLNHGWPGSGSVRTAVWEIAGFHLTNLKELHEPWTRSLVRYGVRAVVADTAGYKDFKDTDRFIEDIRLD